MLLETEKENVCINQLVGQKKDEIIAEGDVIVNDVKPDVLSIISTSGITCVYKNEVMDGKIKLDGSINTYVIYLADSNDSNVRSLNTVLDFTGIINMESCMQNMDVIEKINIKNIETKILNGRKINIKVTLEIETKVYSNNDVSIISNVNNIDDIQVLNSKKTVNLLLGKGKTKVNAKDTISIDEADDLAEIMKLGIKIIDKDIKISYNKILAKADAEILIMYLTEDNRIKTITAKIPIMGFIDIENISENNICDINYTIKNLIIKPNNQDAHSIYVELEIELEALVYETKELNIIEDLYGICEDLNFKNKEITTMSGKKNIKDTCRINETISVPEIANNVLYHVQTNPIILNKTIRNGKIIIEGELNLEFIYDVPNAMESRIINLPFNFDIISDEINPNSCITLEVEVKNENFIVNNGSVDVNVEMEFIAESCKNEKINLIDEINMEENKDSNIYSMVIYFVKPGDTMWKIAKKFKSTVEDIAKINGIEDENNIKVGKQLYIPKFIKREVAI